MDARTSSHEPRDAARRADARRNRERILAAARDAFNKPAADVSMAEIARRAGIGPATLYRNFANRRGLLEALYVDEIDALCAAAAETDAVRGQGDRFLGWLRRFYDYFVSKRFVAEALLEHAGAESPVFGTGYARVVAAGRPLLQAAVVSGDIRTELSLEQILDLIASVAKIPGSADYRQPILEVVLATLGA